MSKIVIFGGGETAILAYEYFTHDSEHTVSAFSLDKAYIEDEEVCGLPVVDIELITEECPPDEFKAFVAVSSTKLNRVRKQLYERVEAMGYQLVSYVSSRAFVWPNVKIGKNCFILENNTLQPFTEVGDNVVLWSGNHIGHRTVIEDHCFIASHCVISGFCRIGESSFLGVNCTLEHEVTIGADGFIGAGALIRKNAEVKAFYQESPTEKAKIDTHRLFRIVES
ncbi:acetyltransferase [Marinobacter alexandrii]|uniref:acetyltransferase n=1 Tax=Marinobacter alexandrii TaxID=2570351 RepID=UPI0032649A35